MTLKGLMTVTRGGKTYRYLRLKGKPLVALPDLPIDSPEFLAAYAEARKASGDRIRAPSGTIRAMIEAYLHSDRFHGLGPSYRHVIRREADEIADQAEDARAADLRQAHIRADLAALDPHKARARLKAWRQICTWAAERQIIPTDPSAGIKRPDIPKSDGHPPWTEAEIARFRARWPIGTTARAAMELLHWTGARISDAVRIGPGMVDRDGVLTFRQEKTGDAAHVPWTCALPDHAAHLEPDRQMMQDALKRLAGHMTFLATDQGRPRSHKSLGTLIITAAREAKVQKSAHGLRKTRAVALAEGGASELQIAAWTGHRSLSEVQHYTKAMARKLAVMGTKQNRNSANNTDQSAKSEKSA